MMLYIIMAQIQLVCVHACLRERMHAHVCVWVVCVCVCTFECVCVHECTRACVLHQVYSYKVDKKIIFNTALIIIVYVFHLKI